MQDDSARDQEEIENSLREGGLPKSLLNLLNKRLGEESTLGSAKINISINFGQIGSGLSQQMSAQVSSAQVSSSQLMTTP